MKLKVKIKKINNKGESNRRLRRKNNQMNKNK